MISIDFLRTKKTQKKKTENRQTESTDRSHRARCPDSSEPERYFLETSKKTPLLLGVSLVKSWILSVVFGCSVDIHIHTQIYIYILHIATQLNPSWHQMTYSIARAQYHQDCAPNTIWRKLCPVSHCSGISRCVTIGHQESSGKKREQNALVLQPEIRRSWEHRLAMIAITDHWPLPVLKYFPLRQNRL